MPLGQIRHWNAGIQLADTGDTVDSSDQYSKFGYTATINPNGTLIPTSRIPDIYEENFEDSSWYDPTIAYNGSPCKFNGIHLSSPLQIGPGIGTSSYAEKNPTIPGLAHGHNKVFLNGAELRMVFKPRKAIMGWNYAVSSSLYNCPTVGFWKQIFFKHINVYKNYVLQKPDSYNQFNGTGTASVSGTTVTLSGLGAMKAHHFFAPGWKIRFHNGDERTVTLVTAGTVIHIDSAPSGSFLNGNSYHVLVKLGSPSPSFTWGYVDILDALPAFLSAPGDVNASDIFESASNWSKTFWPNYGNTVYSPWNAWTSSSIGVSKDLQNRNGPIYLYQHTQRGAPVSTQVYDESLGVYPGDPYYGYLVYYPPAGSHDDDSLTNEQHCWVDDGTGEWAFLLANYGIEYTNGGTFTDDNGTTFYDTFVELGDYHTTKDLEFEITVWETDEIVTPGDVFSVTYQQALDMRDGAGPNFGTDGTPTTWHIEGLESTHGDPDMDWFDPCYEQVFLRLIAK